MAKEINLFLCDDGGDATMPFADEGVHTGFPSPAQNNIDESINLYNELIRCPACTFFGRIVGDSMEDADIRDGDIAVIDKSLEPENEDVAVCFIGGEFTLKRIALRDGKLFLRSADGKLPDIEVNDGNDFTVWGILTHIIKKIR